MDSQSAPRGFQLPLRSPGLLLLHCRDAGRLYGTPKKNRSGRRGQLVKVVLQRAGVKVIEVRQQQQPVSWQAADTLLRPGGRRLLGCCSKVWHATFHLVC